MFGKLLEHFKKEDWKKFCEIGANNFFQKHFVCVWIIRTKRNI